MRNHTADMPPLELANATVIVAGLGGIGSLLALWVTQLASARRLAVRILPLDGDAYSLGDGVSDNRDRQLWAPFVDLAGEPGRRQKALVVAELLQRAFADQDLVVAGLPLFLTHENAVELLLSVRGNLVVLTAFDNHGSRRVAYEAVKDRAAADPAATTVLLQAGNSSVEEDGGHRASVALYAHHQAGLTIDAFRCHPEITAADAAEGPRNDQPHCFDPGLGGTQLLAANALAATMTLGLLQSAMGGQWVEEAWGSTTEFSMNLRPARVVDRRVRERSETDAPHP